MKFNSVWDQRPEDYDKLRQCWLNERRFLYIRDYLKTMPGAKSVLEIGSGTGLLLSRLSLEFPEIHFFGLEPQQSYVEFSRARHLKNVDFSVGEVSALAELLPSHRFDVVLSNDVLHHVNDWSKMFEGVNSISKTGTCWLAIEPNSINPYVFLGQTLKSGERNFNASKFKKFCHRFSWRVEKEDFIFLIPPFVRSAPPILQKVERQIEGLPLFAGGRCLFLLHSEDAL